MNIESFSKDIENQNASYSNHKLKDLAATSLSMLKASSFPTKKNDDWKYTNIKNAYSDNLKLSHNEEVKAKVKLKENSDFIHLVIPHPFEASSLAQISQKIGLNITTLDSTSESDIFSIIGKDEYFRNDFLSVLNNSFLKNGLIIEQMNNKSSDKPILIEHIFNGSDRHHCFQSCLLAQDHSEFNIVEKISSTGSNNYINFKSHSLIKLNAKVSHTILQACSLNDTATIQVNAHILKDALYNQSLVNIGAKVSRTNLFVNLKESNATADAHGLYLLGEDQHHDTMSFIKHSSPHTYSNQLYKGILEDNSRGIFTGKVRVEKDAQQVNAQQLNKNLLIGNKAHANSRPQMEIYADDVKCAHGSTTGQMSEEELFYFTARAIKPETARRMLAEGYSNDVILKINDLQIQKYITNEISKSENINVTK